MPQSWNRYAYVLSNPLVLVDPEGLVGQYFYELCYLRGACSNDYIEVVAESPEEDSEALRGFYELVAARGYSLGLFGLVDDGLDDRFRLTQGEQFLASLNGEAAQSVGDFGVGFGDTISFGATAWYRDEVGLANTIDEDSGSYFAGEIAGYAYGLAWGGAGTVRASGSRALFGKGSRLNTGRYLRVGHSKDKNKVYFSIRGELVDRVSGKPTAHIDLWQIRK